MNEITAAVAVAETLPAPVAKRGVTEAQWRTLCHSLFPGANPQSVLMVVDYCQARQLDPLKKPCHIVLMKVRDARTGGYEWRDVVMPGIYEYRTTAQRTGEYLGHSAPEYGPVMPLFGVEAPEWCAMTIRRWNPAARQSVEFPVRVYFREACATKNEAANQRWAKAPVQMLTKCTEAAGLREAFPDEFGGEPTFEEMAGQDHGGHLAIVVPEPEPVAYPPESFDANLASWGVLIESGRQRADELIAIIETKGRLTDEQKTMLREFEAPSDTETATEADVTVGLI